VPIKPSSSRQIESLIADLTAASAVTRETAVARLTVIGARAVERLLAVAVSHEDAAARSAAWRTLDAIGDARVFDAALTRLAAPVLDAGEGGAVVAIVHGFIRGSKSVAAVDRLTAVALDRSRATVLRLAALRALRTLDGATVAPLLASLAADPDEEVRDAASASDGAGQDADPAATLTRAADQALPDEPAPLRRALGDAGDRVPLPLLLRVLERVREKEGVESGVRRDEWTRTRAAAHVALAARGSRLALYDLRESLDAATAPLPVEFLSALSIVGDASCLESIAAAHAAARDPWWRDHLAEAFRQIVKREKLTKRHAAVKRIEKKSPQTLLDLWPRRSDAVR
jgi:HEAT repeat protein